MNKRMQKLLSVITAGLFVLQSASLVATSISAEDTAAEKDVIKYTPTLDGKLDDQYKRSYSAELDTSVMRHRLTGKAIASDSVVGKKYTEGNGKLAATAYYLWDDGYIYVYADVTDGTISDQQDIKNALRDDNILLTVWNGDDTNYATTSAEVVINAAHNYAYTNSKGETAIASNFSKEYGTATDAAEYVAKVKNDRSGYIVEARIAVNDLAVGSTLRLALGGNDFVSGSYNMYAFGLMYEKDDCTSSAFKTVKLAGAPRKPADMIARATAEIDGVMDEAYNETYFVSGGHTEISFLWNSGYYYMYATIEDSTANNKDILYVTFMYPQSTQFWSEACALEFHLKKNTAKMTEEFGTAYEGCGGNFARKAATENTPAAEYSIKRTDTGYVVEARIACKSVSPAKEIMFGFGVKDKGKWYDGCGDDSGATWQKVYNGGNFDGDGVLMTCGAGHRDEVVPTEGNIVKHGTPTLDGRLDGIYKGSHMIDTRDILTNGELEFNWNNDADNTLDEYVDAGFIDDITDKKLKPTGDLTAKCLTYAQIYFLWDDDALYVFTKVYDNDIHDLCAETDYTYSQLPTQCEMNAPWLNESIIHNIFPEQNHAIAMSVDAIASGALFDRKACSEPGVYGLCDACVNFDTWSGLHCWNHVGEDLKESDRANLASEFHADQGYYTIEVRIPISERSFADTTLKDYFLFSGEKFDYNFSLWDVRGKLVGSSFDGASAKSHISFANTKDITMVLSSEESVAPPCEHEWNEEYTIDKPASCTVAGERSIHCALCDEVKPGSVETVPATGHNYVDGKCTVCGAIQSPVAKKYTPVLDGKLDDAYLDSASFKASDLGKSGKLNLGWSDSANGVGALIDAGLLADDKSTEFLPDGKYDDSAFTDAEVYFLWDDDALYVYTKVYDDDPIDITSSPFFKEEGRTVYGSIGADRPCINDTVSQIINPLENPYATINATGDAFGHYAWDSETGGWSDLCHFETSDAAAREASAANVKTTVTEDGYAVELRIPISSKGYGSTPLKEAFLKDGSTFTYKYQLIDTVTKLVGTPFKDNGYQCAEWIMYSSSALTVELSDAAPHIHTWAEDYTTDKEATCTEAGSKSIHCTECDAVKADSVTDIEALGHDWSEEYTVDTAATCTAEGSQSIHCKRCDEKKPDSAVAVPKIAHTFKDGKCEVCGHVYGDITGDSTLDTKDLVRLMKYIAAKGEGIEGVEPDINGDGNVDTKDLIRLMKALSGDKSVIPAAPETPKTPEEPKTDNPQ